MLSDGLLLLALLLLALAIRQWIGMPVYVKGNSMLSTLQNQEIVLVSRATLHSDGVQRGDVVICNYEGRYWDRWKLLKQHFVKRVVGLPGETIAIEDGTVIVNGEPLDEPYLDARYTKRLVHMAPYTLEEDEYFVLGDNRDNSNDSRRVGAIRQSDLVGVVKYVVWPLSAMRPVTRNDQLRR